MGFTIFTHPDAPEHMGVALSTLRRVLKLIHTGSVLARTSIGYYPLAQQMVVDPKRTWGAKYAADWRKFWNRLYAEPWKSYGFRAPRCRWEPQPGFYLGGFVEGLEDRQTRHGAKAACGEHDECFGVTCGTALEPEEDKDELFLNPHIGRSTCTPRRGIPSGLLQSPGKEVSYVKQCASNEWGTMHDHGLDEADEEDGSIAFTALPDAEASRKAPRFVRYQWAYLAGYAAGDDALRDLEATKLRCTELGDTCAGVTCEDAAEAACSVRSGAEVLESPVGEVSYRKEFGPVTDETRMPSPPGPSIAGASAHFQMYTGSQSVVHRERLRLWPRARYEEFAEDGAFCSQFTGQFEAVWHAMFGEPLSQWTRERDPSLPLFLKWGVPTITSFGDEGVI